LITTGFVAATKHHPFFKKVLDTYHAFDLGVGEFKFLVNNEL
jgi:hypothetical protein